MANASAQLIFVTGKGGVGKTTVAAALGQNLGEAGHDCLIVDTAAEASIERLFGLSPRDNSRFRKLTPNLDVTTLTARKLIEEYFERTLRFAFLARRLLQSSAFSALTDAAPGISEFLLLERLELLCQPSSLRRRSYDYVIVDGPASGHVMRLFATPTRLSAIVGAGPLSGSVNSVRKLLTDPARTHVLVVSLAEELAVTETGELWRQLTNQLQMNVLRPIVNRVFPRRFSNADIRALDEGTLAVPQEIATSVRYASARRRDAERNVAILRRSVGIYPMVLRHILSETLTAAEIRPLGRRVRSLLTA